MGTRTDAALAQVVAARADLGDQVDLRERWTPLFERYGLSGPIEVLDVGKQKMGGFVQAYDQAMEDGGEALASAIVGSEGLVYAIEPNPENARLIAHTIDTTRLTGMPM